MKKSFARQGFSLLAAFLALPLGAALAAPVTIGGTVRNGTEKNAPLPNATVLLVRPQDGGKSQTLATTRSDARGQFSFPSRDLTDKDLLMVKVNRGGFDYWTVAFDGGNKLNQVGIKADPKKADLLVFDTTSQAIPLKYQVHHLAISSTEKGIKCVERIVVVNQGERTLMGIGPNKVSLWLNLPEGAKNVKLDEQMEGKLVKTSGGYGYAHPITPEAYGVRNALIFSYEMDWPGTLPWQRSVNLSRETVYPTEFFFVARETKDKDLEVKAPLLSPTEEQQLPIEGKMEVRLVNAIGAPSMPNMPAGTEPTPPALSSAKMVEVSVGKPVNPIFWGFAGLTIALCLFLPLALVKPKKGAKSQGAAHKKSELSENGFVSSQSFGTGDVSGASLLLAGGVSSQLSANPHAQKLIQQIADLDDLHEAGKISDTEYQAQRAAWKQELLNALQSPSPQS